MQLNTVSNWHLETKMGTYTTNYNLFMPSIGEQGWGELVNGNFSTIDTTMKSLSNSIGTLETETDAVEERVTALEENIPIDSSGNIVGNMVGKLYVRAITSATKRNGDIGYAEHTAQTLYGSKYGGNTTLPTQTVNDYSKISMSYPYQLVPGIYILSSEYFTDSVPSTFTATLTWNKPQNTTSNPITVTCYCNNVEVAKITAAYRGTYTETFTVNAGDSIHITIIDPSGNGAVNTISVTISEQPIYYISVV